MGVERRVKGRRRRRRRRDGFVGGWERVRREREVRREVVRRRGRSILGDLLGEEEGGLVEIECNWSELI